MKKRNRQTFTLIELLVVMLLMGVLMTLMLPAFNRMISGNSVDQMTSNLKLGLEQAQSRAVTSRRHVALILPSRNVWTGEMKKYCNGGYRIAFVKENGSSWEFEKWVPDSEWKNAPEGAMLVKVVQGDKNNLNGEFDSNGGVKGVPKKMNDSIGSSGSFIDVANVPRIDAGQSAMTMEAIIFTPYGGTKNPALLFISAEAIASSTDIAYPTRVDPKKPDEAPTNSLTLGINQFTGRVEYLK